MNITITQSSPRGSFSFLGSSYEVEGFIVMKQETKKAIFCVTRVGCAASGVRPLVQNSSGQHHMRLQHFLPISFTYHRHRHQKIPSSSFTEAYSAPNPRFVTIVPQFATLTVLSSRTWCLSASFMITFKSADLSF